MNIKKENIIAFGEIMLRLTPPDYTLISQTNNFIANYGGGEANVLVSLSHLSHHTSFISKVPDNPLGESAINHLNKHGVNTKYVLKGSLNLGMYFVETGFGGRPSRVIYNRKHSAITEMEVNELNYDEIFKNATWFHLSGITLALGDKVRKIAFKCLEYAKKYNVTISFDFNYRSKLWDIKTAKPFYKKIISYGNVLFASYFDIHTMLDININEKGLNELDKQIAIFKKLIDKSNIDYIFGTNRIIHTANDNSLSSFCIDKKGKYLNEGPIRFNIYDRIGGGDAFASGVIHGLITNYNNPKYALKFGLATSILKHTLYGDVSTLSVSEVEEFMNNGSAAIKR